MANFGPLMAEIGWRFEAPQPISTGFAFWLCYCSDVVHRRLTKRCTMFGRLLGWYTIFAFSGAFMPSDGILLGAIFTLRPSLAFSVLAALLRSTRPAGVSQTLRRGIQGMELRNFRRRRHLYSAGRPSRWASTHILVETFLYAYAYALAVFDIEFART